MRASGATGDHVLGTIDPGRVGPTVIAVAGVHGNEPAGVAAARRVLAALDRGGIPVAGRLWAVAGNPPALAARKRFIDRDLNRLWTAEQIAALDATPPSGDDSERRDQRVLLGLFRRLAADAERERQPFVVLDLHSTSGPSAPFSVINDTLESRRLALASQLPLVLGLEEILRGTLLDYVDDQGHPYVLFEGGRHDDAATVETLEAALWRALVSLRVVAARDVPHGGAHATTIRRAVADAPRVVEITYLHEIGPDDGFRMRPGYRGFAPVTAGEVLAVDRHGEIRAPSDGLLMLPLYQPWGTDGFFIGRVVGRGWLTVSALLRAAGAARVLPWLPGVARDRTDRDLLHVDPRIARWLVPEVFHLAGFRRLPSVDGRLVFRNRTRHRRPGFDRGPGAA